MWRFRRIRSNFSFFEFQSFHQVIGRRITAEHVLIRVYNSKFFERVLFFWRLRVRRSSRTIAYSIQYFITKSISVMKHECHDWAWWIVQASIVCDRSPLHHALSHRGVVSPFSCQSLLWSSHGYSESYHSPEITKWIINKRFEMSLSSADWTRQKHTKMTQYGMDHVNEVK